jgi:hypothetical protein
MYERCRHIMTVVGREHAQNDVNIDINTSKIVLYRSNVSYKCTNMLYILRASLPCLGLV